MVCDWDHPVSRMAGIWAFRAYPARRGGRQTGFLDVFLGGNVVLCRYRRDAAGVGRGRMDFPLRCPSVRRRAAIRGSHSMGHRLRTFSLGRCCLVLLCAVHRGHCVSFLRPAVSTSLRQHRVPCLVRPGRKQERHRPVNRRRRDDRLARRRRHFAGSHRTADCSGSSGAIWFRSHLYTANCRDCRLHSAFRTQCLSWA